MKKKKFDFTSLFYYIVCFYLVGGFVSNIYYDKKNDENKTYSILVNSEVSDNIIDNVLSKVDIDLDEDNRDELVFLNSIYENSNLSDNEKNIFYGYYSIVNDLEYLDRDSAYKALSTVSINYVNRDESISSKVLGDYNYAENKINIYSNKNVNDVLRHEGIHCMFNNSKTMYLPTYFSEGVTELLSDEYFSNDPFYDVNSYPFEIAYVKMLCELVGSDNVLKAYSTGDFSIITKYLDKYNNSSYTSTKILDIYEDTLKSIETDYESIYTLEDKKNAYKYINDIYYRAHPDLKNYNDFNYLHELSGCIFEESPSEFFAEYLIYYNILEKPYFSKELKSRYKNSNYVNIYKKSSKLERNDNSWNLTK